MEFRICSDCKKILSFEEFLRDNPALNKVTADDIWSNSLYSVYCLDCFYNLPERPFKIRKGYHRSYYRKLTL